MKRKLLPVDRFFRIQERNGRSVTYGDIRLKTGYSAVAPAAAQLDSRFTRHVSLKIPIASAAMDDVTEAPMAIAMAKSGGIGVIHCSMPVSRQAQEVARVKFHLQPRIANPITVRDADTVGEILAKRKRKRWKFHSFLVLDESGNFVGLLTRKNFKLCMNPNLTARDIMLPVAHVITAPEKTSMERALALMQQHGVDLLPLMRRKTTLAGMYAAEDIKRIMTGSQAQFNLDSDGRLRVAAAVNTDESDLDRAEALVQQHVDVLVIEKAHGDSYPEHVFLKMLRRRHTSIDIVAGNISEPDSCRRLIREGADAVKVGQGPGSICSTRVVSGIGAPQATAVYNCSRAAQGSGVPIIADGGIVNPGDIPVALGCGADSVMVGGVLAGTKETPGDIIKRNGQQFKRYRGMGSLSAMRDRKASRRRYQQDHTPISQLVPEGVESIVPYKGRVKRVLVQFMGGLRSGMSYCGTRTIADLHRKADFHFNTPSGVREGHPHDVLITEIPPNYQVGR